MGKRPARPRHRPGATTPNPPSYAMATNRSCRGQSLFVLAHCTAAISLHCCAPIALDLFRSYRVRSWFICRRSVPDVKPSPAESDAVLGAGSSDIQRGMRDSAVGDGGPLEDVPLTSLPPRARRPLAAPPPPVREVRMVACATTYSIQLV